VEEEPQYQYYDSRRDAARILAEREAYKHQRRAVRLGTIARLFRNPLALIGLLVILIFILLALLYPILMHTIWNPHIYDPFSGFDPSLEHHPSFPGRVHLLGTDALGRDVLSQFLYAARTSLGVGLLAGLTATIIATTIGVLAAYFGGWVDNLLMMMSDTFMLMPPAIITLIVGLVISMTWWSMGLLFGILAGLGTCAITCKSQALTIRIKPYIDASRIAGGSGMHIILKHIIPGMLSVMMVTMMFVVSQAMMIEALISFYQGTESRLSWGTMIWFIQSTFWLSPHAGQWHAILPPALAITILCGAFYMLGRALDEVVNPQLRER
jgi:peptide/nickel transport system permease protein